MSDPTLAPTTTATELPATGLTAEQWRALIVARYREAESAQANFASSGPSPLDVTHAKVALALQPLRSLGGYYHGIAAAIEGVAHALLHHGEPVEAPLESRDETHDSIDPHTGTLSRAALAQRSALAAEQPDPVQGQGSPEDGSRPPAPVSGEPDFATIEHEGPDPGAGYSDPSGSVPTFVLNATPPHPPYARPLEPAGEIL